MMRFILAFLAVALIAPAQDKQAPAQDKQAPAPATLLQVTVTDAGKKPVPSAKVTLKGSDGKTYQAATDATGKFTLSIPVGDYQVEVSGEGFSTSGLSLSTAAGKDTAEIALPVTVTANKKDTPVCPPGDKACPSLDGSLLGVALGLAVVFWAIVLATRFYNIQSVNRNLLRAAIETAEQDLVKATPATQSRAKALVDGACAALASKPNYSFFFGTTGQELSAWSRLHEASRVLAEDYDSDQTIAALRVVVERLRPEYSTLADKIDATLGKVSDPDPAQTPALPFLKATLREGLFVAAKKSQDAIAGILNWQNKAFTLILIGLCLLLALAGLLPHGLLLLVGFAGGFASRLMRGKTNSDSSSMDLHWTTLFLSPIYGAFSAWAGIFLLILLDAMQVLGPAVNGLHLKEICAANIPILALAFLFGFSERLFSAITDLAEKSLTDRKNATPADSPSTPKPGLGASAGIPANPLAPAVTSAAVDPGTKALTLTGENLTATTNLQAKLATGDAVKLQVTPGATPRTLAAKPADGSVLPAGKYEVLLDGKQTGVLFTIQ